MISPQEIKRLIFLFPHHQLVHKMSTITGNKLSSQPNNITIRKERQTFNVVATLQAHVAYRCRLDIAGGSAMNSHSGGGSFGISGSVTIVTGCTGGRGVILLASPTASWPN